MATLVVVGGCAKEDQPITAKSSNYQVGEEEPAKSSSAGSQDGATREAEVDRPSASGSMASSTLDSAPRTAPPQRDTSRSADSARSSSGAAAATAPASNQARSAAAPVNPQDAPAKPESLSRDELDQIKVPDGTPEELWKFMEDLARTQPRASTQQEYLQAVQDMLQAQITAAEKILANTEADPMLRKRSVEFKLGALQELTQLGVEEAQPHMVAFVRALQNDPDKDLARIGRFFTYALEVGDVAEKRSNDAAAVVTGAQKILQREEKNEETLHYVRTAAIEMTRAGYKEEGQQIADFVKDAYADVNDEELQELVSSMREEVHFMKLDLAEKINAFANGVPDSLTSLAEATKQLFAKPEVGRTTLHQASLIGDAMERAGETNAAKEVYSQIAAAFKSTQDDVLKKLADQIVASADKRMKMLDQPFSLEGHTADNTALNWPQFRAGKVVLVSFWTASSREYVEREIPRLRGILEVYRDRGFEIISVNVDEDQQRLKQFFAFQSLPWPTVLDGALGQRKMTKRYGVQVLPFNLLVDRDGKVAAIHVTSYNFTEKVAGLLEPAAGPAGQSGEQAAPAAEATGQAQPQQPQSNAATHLNRPRLQQSSSSHRSSFASIAADEPQTDDGTPSGTAKPATDAADKQSAEQGAAKVDNPYLAPPDLNRQQLADFLLKMEDKPKSIRARPGFDAALVDAADRILADGQRDALQLIAAQTKLQTLHRQAMDGSKEADGEIAKMLTALQDDDRPQLAEWLKMLSLEREVLAVDDMPLEGVPDLLGRLATYYGEQPLGQQHLRMASATVHAINRLDVEQRETYFQQFGKLFATSKDRELSRYGRKIAESNDEPPSELVGKPLELAGITALGLDLDWESYRGKVVLVDFWASWCGPCHRETPLLKALLEKHGSSGLEVVGVNLDQDGQAAAKYVDENEVPWTSIVGADAIRLAQKYDIRGIPALLLVDREGKVTAVAHRSADLQNKLEQLLAR